MVILKCYNNCCTLKISKYVCKENNKIYKSTYKSGIFIYDKYSNKILIVQSNGRLWGIPKGSIKNRESVEDCAIREVREETGLNINKDELRIYTKIKKKATYFFIEMEYVELEIQKSMENNDANSIGWIKPECIIKLIEKNKLQVNRHFKILLERFLNITI